MDELLQLAKTITNYCDYCATSPISTVECLPFWQLLDITAAGAVILALLFWLRRELQTQTLIREHNAWIAAQAVIADAETINQHKWEGDAAIDIAATQEEIAIAIRDHARSQTTPTIPLPELEPATTTPLLTRYDRLS
jgi:hypothetical protein